MKRNTLILLLVALLAAAAGAVGGALLFARAEPPSLATGTLLSEARALPEFRLVSDDGGNFTRKNLEGQWDLVFFGFTHCPDVCPNTLFLLDRVTKQLEQQGVQSPRVVFVSVDPERDTAEDVRAYVDYFNESFAGVTAHGVDVENLQRITQAMSVAYEYRRNGDEYEVIHSSAVLLVDPAAHMRAIFTPPLQAAEIAADLALLLED